MCKWVDAHLAASALDAWFCVVDSFLGLECLVMSTQHNFSG